MEKLKQELPPLKKSKLSKKIQEEENKIKIKLIKASQEWCDWKFLIHWNKLEWLNPRSRYERKIHFVCPKKAFKDNNEPAHWVGHSKLGSPDLDEFF